MNIKLIQKDNITFRYYYLVIDCRGYEGLEKLSDIANAFGISRAECQNRMNKVIGNFKKLFFFSRVQEEKLCFMSTLSLSEETKKYVINEIIEEFKSELEGA